MPGLEPANRSRPVQVAKRKRKPLGHEEIVLRKKSKTKAVTVEDDEISTSLDGQEEPKTFISPERFLDKSKVRDENEELRGHRAGRKINGGRQRDKEASTQLVDNKPGSTQHALHVEKPIEPSADRFVTSAQEDLIQMIEKGASDKAIENQTKIIRMLQARLLSQQPRSSSAQPQMLKKIVQNDTQTKVLNKNVSESSKPSKPASTPRHPLSISSSPSSSPYSSPTPLPVPAPAKRPARTSLPKVRTTRKKKLSPTPSPTPKKPQTRDSIAKAKTTRETKELLKTARPASAPTSLPPSQRTNKSLTTTEVAKLSKVHPTFDEKETNKLDKHTRKINRTGGMASDKPVMPERGLESRIRAPTESPEPETPRRSGLRLDAKNLRAAAAAAGRQGFSRGKSISVNQPARGNVDTSPRELEESVKALHASLSARQMPFEHPAAAAAAVEAQSRQGGRPGQVYNEVTERWQYVEEIDSDDD